MNSNLNEEQFPLEDISKFNIYANFIPTTQQLSQQQQGYEIDNNINNNNNKKDGIEQLYHTNYYINDNNNNNNNNNERYNSHHHHHHHNNINNNNQQQHILDNEYEIWYDYGNNNNTSSSNNNSGHNNSHHHHHNDLHKMPIDVTSTTLLKSNLLKLLADGRIVLLSRIPILYRAKFGREFRDDIDCDGKVKLIEVFQALGSPFVLLGDGGNASVKRELPYHNSMNQYPSNQYQYNNNEYYRPHNLQQQQQQHQYQYSYNTNTTNTAAAVAATTTSSSSTTPISSNQSTVSITSELQPKYRHTNNSLTYHEAQTRLKNNLDILLDDGIEILLTDIPAAYKARFGIEYRDGLEYKGKIKLNRLFQQYGHPYILSGEGLDMTVRKVIYSSTNSRYLNGINQTNSNWFPVNNQTTRSVTGVTGASISTSTSTNNSINTSTSFIGLSYPFMNQEIINSDIPPSQTIRSSYFQNNLTNSNINNNNINSNNQNFPFSQIESLESLEKNSPLYDQVTSNNDILPAFEYLNTSSFISDIRNDCFEVPPESPNNVYNEDIGILSNLPDNSLTLSRLPISNSSISTTSTVSMYPHYDTSAIPPSILESPYKKQLSSSQSRPECFSRSVTPTQFYTPSTPIDYSKWSHESDLGCLGKISCNSTHPINCPCTPIYLDTIDSFCIINIGQSVSGISNTLKILLENCLISPNYHDNSLSVSDMSNTQQEDIGKLKTQEVKIENDFNIDDNNDNNNNDNIEYKYIEIESKLNSINDDNTDNNNNNQNDNNNTIHKNCDETMLNTEDIPKEDLSISQNKLQTQTQTNSCKKEVLSSTNKYNSVCTLSFYSNPQKLQTISDLPNLQNIYQSNINDNNNKSSFNLNLHGMKKIIILVSPTYYYQNDDLLNY